MKKISTLVAAMLIGGVAVAQNVPMKPAASYNLKSALITEKTNVVNPQLNPNRAVFYTNDFSNPSDWTMFNTSSPALDWQIVTALTPTLVSQGFGPNFNGATGNFALIDSDAAGGTATQDASIVLTNSLDLSLNSTCQLTFRNYHRRYLETHYVVVSTDGGTTWTDIEVNDSYATSTTSPNSEMVTVNLTCLVANQANVKIGFRYVGAWDWFWAIDDVELADATANDVKLSTHSYYSATQTLAGDNPHYSIFPANQAQPMAHTALLQNIGSANATNARLTASVLDPVNTPVYNGNGNASTLGVCSATSANSTTTTNYTPGSTAGQYRNVFVANHDDLLLDGTPVDNVDTLKHWINPLTYAVDDNTYRGSGLWNGAGNGYEMGPLYAIYNNVTLYSIDVALTGNTNQGVVMYATLYEIDPTTGDFNSVATTSGTANEVTVSAAQISVSPTITWVRNILTSPVTLTAGTEYIAVVGHYGGTDNLVVMQGGTGADTSTIFLLDGTNNTWYYMTSFPMVRMNFDASIGYEELSNNNFTLYQNVPNPSNTTTRITFNLNEAASVQFEIVDITGKTVMSTNLGNKSVGNHNMTLDVSPFASGVYYYSVIVNGQKMTKKMVITE